MYKKKARSTGCKKYKTGRGGGGHKKYKPTKLGGGEGQNRIDTNIHGVDIFGKT